MEPREEGGEEGWTDIEGVKTRVIKPGTEKKKHDCAMRILISNTNRKETLLHLHTHTPLQG